MFVFYVFGKTDFVLVSYLPLTFSLPLILSFSFISTSHLRRMRLECCKTISDKALIEVAEKLPLLEELDVSLCYLSCKSLEAVGRCCPRLRSLKFNMEVYPRISLGYDDEAFAIAKNMPKLQHLQLIGNKGVDGRGDAREVKKKWYMDKKIGMTIIVFKLWTLF